MNIEKMSAEFSIGADISWYPQMLKSGFVFKNKDGAEQDLLVTLKEYNVNSIRLRTWVNPSDDSRSGHCSAEETLALAKLCRDQGFDIMLDFHYSDTWCDPGKQRKPRAWEDLDFEELVSAVYSYTYETVALLKDNGAAPKWIQIGNETNPGMLLPDGSTDDFSKLSRLITAGHDAVKAVSPEIITIVHLAEFNYTDFIANYFDRLKENDCRYDMMGFSFYPYHLPGVSYEESLRGFERSMKEIPERYKKEFMIVETGGVDIEEEESYKLLTDMIDRIKTQPLCNGLYLWEPEGARCWSNYPLSAWRDDGCPTKAMDALKEI